jgi:hypothetical protein
MVRTKLCQPPLRFVRRQPGRRGFQAGKSLLDA